MVYPIFTPKPDSTTGGESGGFFFLLRRVQASHTHCSRNNVLIMQMPAGGANRRGHPSGTMGIGFEYVAVLLASAVAIAGVSRGKGGSILQE